MSKARTLGQARPPLVGRVQPRLWARPLRKLTPRTSKGFAVIAFATALGIVLMPWQKWLLVHALELRPDGSYRFRYVVVLVSRQNGKTTVLKVLTLWRLLEDGALLALGSSTNMEYAREAWSATVDLAEQRDDQREPDAPKWVRSVRRGALDTSLRLTNGGRYKIASASRTGGRSLAVDLAMADELREHKTWEAWAAMDGTTTARPDPQQWALSNAGDDTSIVLNHERALGLSWINDGVGDDSLGLFEWSAPDGCALDDRRAWRAANPALGHTITEATLISKLATNPPEVFRTEYLCQNVPSMDMAVDLDAWRDCVDSHGTMDGTRGQLALVIDVAPDLRHVSLLAAAVLADGRVRVEVVAAWESTDAARHDLADLRAKIRPRVFGWFPGGPAASLTADLKDSRDCVEITSASVPAVCMGFAEQVAARRVLHPNDPLLTAQTSGVSKLYTGDGWRFTRRGVGHCDATYAAAGAVHLARTLPPPKPRPMLVVASG